MPTNNLNKGYADIGTPTNRTVRRPATPTKAGTPRTQTVRVPTQTTPAKSPPNPKPAARPQYERMTEKDTPSHRITEAKNQMKDEYKKFKKELDDADRNYFNARKRVDIYGKRGMVNTQAELQYAEELKAWQEENKARFRAWVDETIEKSRVNTKAPGTFNNMLDDAEEILTDLDSRRPPEQYRTQRIAEGRAARIARPKLTTEKAEDSNVVTDLGELVGESGLGLMSNEEVAKMKAEDPGYKKVNTDTLKALEKSIDDAAKAGGWSKEQVYTAKASLRKSMEPLIIKSQMETAKRKLEADDEKDDGGLWGAVGNVLGGAKDIAGNIGGRAIDVASRPLYAVAGGAESFLEGGLRNPGKKLLPEMLKGVTGEDKTTFSDVLLRQMDKAGYKPDTWYENIGVAGTGLALDIVADPTTYITLGATTAGKAAALKTAKELGNAKVTQKILREAPEAVRRNLVKEAPFETATKAAKFQESVASTAKIAKEATKMRNDAVLALKKKGIAVSADESEQIYQEAVNTLTRADATAYEVAARSGQKPRLAVRFAGKDIGDIAPVGRALEAAHVPFTAVNKAYKSTSFGRAMSEMFNMRAHFPGLTDRLRRINESRGLVRHEEFQRTIDKLLKGLSKDERYTLSHAIESGRDLTGTVGSHGKDLGDIQTELLRLQDELWDEKVYYGLNKDTDKANNYLFHYYKGTVGATPTDIRNFKKARKSALRAHVHAPTLAEAKAAGMNPYEDVGDIFKLMHADHQRKMSRFGFKHDVMERFGLLTNKPAVAKANGLVDVTAQLPPDLKAIAIKQNKRYYLHRDIVPTFQRLDKMHSLASGEELNRLMRFTSRFTNWWKSTATVYNPGNWINNSMGDVVLNFFDGVQHPKWYKMANDVVLRGLSDNKVVMRVGSHGFTRGELWDLYRKYGGSAGFLRADVDDVAFRVAPAARHKIHSAYQKREDFSRFAHFAYSLRDELTRIPKSGQTKLLAHRIEKAAEAASDRVARFNIDYSAFTPFERTVKGTAVPFYSWMRKALPLMLENAFMRPGRYSAIQKSQKALETALGVPREWQGEYNVEYPQWLRDSGMIRLTGGPTPTVIRNPLPTNIFGQIFGGADMQEMLRGNLASLHPAIQAPFEIAQGKQLFSGANVPEGDAYLASKFPVTAVLGAISGYEFPGQKEWDLQSRIGRLAGSKPYTVDNNAQAGELRRQQDPLDAQVRQLNQKIYPIQVQKTSKGYVILNDENGRRFDKVFADPKDAYEIALKLKKQGGLSPTEGG